MAKRKQESIWQYYDDWKVHVTNKELKEEVQKKFNLRNSTTTYYESGTWKEETSWDLLVPDNLINKVKKYIKDNS